MRPQFHFTAESGWINDPHAITFRDGRYHVFYQYVPDSLVWAPNCHWGHATGADLFDTSERGIALAPGDGDDGIWTGSLVTDDAGASRIFYTSVVQPGIGIGRVRVATPKDDGWLEWEKGAVVVRPPGELDIIAYRDPFVFRDGDLWRMYIGAGLGDGTATALGYSSSDLESWAFEGIAAERSTHEREPVWMGALWECPQLFAIGDRHAMVSSVWDDDVLHYAGYGIGDFADGDFTATTWGQLSYGPSYYAPSLFRDAADRPCLVFWMRGVKDEAAGWSSAHSIPYVLELEGDRLRAMPHPDLAKYTAEPSVDGSVDGLAAVASWTPAGATDVLTVTSGDEVAFKLSSSDTDVTLVIGSESWTMPTTGEELVVVVDGPTVEVVGAAGILGSAIAPAGSTLAFSSAGALSVSPLRK